MKSDLYCTLETVTICQWSKKASNNYKDGQVYCGIEIYKLTIAKCKRAIEFWLKLTSVATFIQTLFYHNLNKHSTFEWPQIH